eukprot:gene25593-30906_t
MIVLIAAFTVTLLLNASAVSKVKVVIAGGGPTGLLSAYTLLHRKNEKYEVHIYDANMRPRDIPAGSRSYSLGLNMRGQGALKQIAEKYDDPALFPAIEKEGVYCDSFFIYLPGNRFAIRQANTSAILSPDNKKVPPTLLLPRNRLSGALLDRIEQRFPESSYFRPHFQQKVVSANFDRKEVTLSDGSKTNYDLLIGADGLQSAVRDAMLLNSIHDERRFEAEVTNLGGNYKVMLQDCPTGLETNAIHYMELGGLGQAGFSLFVIPTLGNKVCVLTLWQGDIVPEALRPDIPAGKVKALFKKFYPKFGEPSDDAVKQMQNQRVSQVRVVRCNRYHDTPGRVVLMGDSAHCTGGTLGQGANSALMDVVTFDQVLDYTGGDFRIALPLYSSLQVPEGLALWKLLQLPPKIPLYGFAYQVTQWLADQANKVPQVKKLKLVPQTVQNLISKSDVSFSEIADQNQFWIRLAASDWDKFEYTPEPSRYEFGQFKAGPRV